MKQTENFSGTTNASNEEQLELDKISDIILADTISELDYVGEYVKERRWNSIF